MALNEYEIVVDGPGTFQCYLLKAKDLKTAKRKAKMKAIADFRKSLKVYKDKPW